MLCKGPRPAKHRLRARRDRSWSAGGSDGFSEKTADDQADDYVFPSPRGLYFASLQKPLRRIRKAMAKALSQKNVEFRFHDLRRTAASHMTAIGIPRPVVSKILNHVEQGITKVYARHSYDADA